jgi:hypothetical protein
VLLKAYIALMVGLAGSTGRQASLGYWNLKVLDPESRSIVGLLLKEDLWRGAGLNVLPIVLPTLLIQN